MVPISHHPSTTLPIIPTSPLQSPCRCQRPSVSICAWLHLPSCSPSWSSTEWWVLKSKNQITQNLWRLIPLEDMAEYLHLQLLQFSVNAYWSSAHLFVWFLSLLLCSTMTSLAGELRRQCMNTFTCCSTCSVYWVSLFI